MTRGTDLKVIGGLLALAIAIGGAGVSFPRLGMLLEFCALVVAGYLVVSKRIWRFPRLTWLALALLGLILLLPALQLVPLPATLWQQLPGRQLAVETDAALGWSRWRPLTLDVEGTIRSLLNLLPAAAIFIGCLFISVKARIQLLWIVLGGALVSALLGIAQLASGGSFTPFPSAHLGYPVGLFVNRNHSAALLLVAMPIAAALGGMQIARGNPRVPWVIASLSAIITFAIVVLGTTSRMGLALLPISFAGALLLLFYRQSTSRVLLSSVAAIAAVTSLLFASGGFDRTIARFSGFADPRLDYWTDIQWALNFYGLAGTGFGTFVPVYKSAESLEAVVPQTTNHAHNDYLEILLEGGVPAVLVFSLFAVVVAMALVRLCRSKLGPEQLLPAGAAAGGIALLLAWSSVDYPLRMPSLSAVFALLCALLLPTGFPLRATAGTNPPVTTAQQIFSRSPRRLHVRSILIAFSVLAVLLVLVLQAGMSAHHISNHRYEAALKWARWSTQAHERISTQALLRNDVDVALPQAYSAIALSPISTSAIRTVGLIRLSDGEAAQGNRLMQVAVGLGWRDPLTQLWAIQASAASREPEKALQRAEALFQQDVLVMPAVILLLGAPPETGMLPLLARRLEQRPNWRSVFFKAGSELPADYGGAWAQLVGLLAQSKAPVLLEEGQSSLDSLVARGAIEEAQRVWTLLHGNELVANGDFEVASGRRGRSFPTHWLVPHQARSRVTVGRPEFDPATRALHVRGKGDAVVLSQTLMLAPGRYAFTFRAQSAASRVETVRWELRCESSGIRQSNEAKLWSNAKWQNVTSTFTVPIQHCPTQRLALRTLGGIDSTDVWLDEIQLERVPH